MMGAVGRVKSNGALIPGDILASVNIGEGEQIVFLSAADVIIAKKVHAKPKNITTPTSMPPCAGYAEIQAWDRQFGGGGSREARA